MRVLYSQAVSTSVSDPHTHRVGKSSQFDITCVGGVASHIWSSPLSSVSIATSAAGGLRRPSTCRLRRFSFLVLTSLACLSSFFFSFDVFFARAAFFSTSLGALGAFLGDLRPKCVIPFPAGLGGLPRPTGLELILACRPGRPPPVPGTAPPTLCGAGGGQYRALQGLSMHLKVRGPGLVAPGTLVWGQAWSGCSSISPR